MNRQSRIGLNRTVRLFDISCAAILSAGALLAASPPGGAMKIYTFTGVGADGSKVTGLFSYQPTLSKEWAYDENFISFIGPNVFLKLQYIGADGRVRELAPAQPDFVPSHPDSTIEGDLCDDVGPDGPNCVDSEFDVWGHGVLRSWSRTQPEASTPVEVYLYQVGDLGLFDTGAPDQPLPDLSIAPATINLISEDGSLNLEITLNCLKLADYTLSVGCSCNDSRDALAKQYTQTGVFSPTGVLSRGGRLQPIAGGVFAPPCQLFTQNIRSSSYQHDVRDPNKTNDWGLGRYPLNADSRAALGVAAWLQSEPARTITSLYRSPQEQKNLRGVLGSPHMYGDAVDVAVDGCSATTGTATDCTNEQKTTIDALDDYIHLMALSADAHPDYIEPPTEQCLYRCVHIDWRKTTGVYQPIVPTAEGQ